MFNNIMDTPTRYSDDDLRTAFRSIAMVHSEWAEERCRAAVNRLCSPDKWGHLWAVLTPREVVAYAHDLRKEIWPCCY